MSKETVMEVIEALPPGCYVHNLTNFINGSIATTKRKTVKLSIEIGIDQLGSPFDDLRAVASPLENKLVPLLLFVEPEVFLKSKGDA